MDIFLFKGHQRSGFFHFLGRFEGYTDVTIVSASDLTQTRLCQGGSKREGLGQKGTAKDGIECREDTEEHSHRVAEVGCRMAFHH